MINDILKDSTTPYSLYADDVAIWYSDSDLQICCEHIQLTLNNLQKWANDWGFTFSAAKSKAIFFTKKRLPDYPLTLNSETIHIVPSFKFLGLHFDKNLIWKNHITETKTKCTSDLNLLKIVAAQKWGADFTTLRQLYISLTLSKITYASFLYDTASPTNLKILDRLQYSAARIILGSLRCTKVQNLEYVSNLLPLSQFRKLQLSKYTCSILSVQGNPLRRLILDYYPFPHYSFFKYPLPICGRILEEFKKSNIMLKNIGSSPISSKYLTHSNLALSTLHTCPKDDLTPAQWRCQFNNLIQEYRGHYTIYTDGSVCGTKSGCGAWASDFSLKARLPDNFSIFSCELYAIYVSIMYSLKSPLPILILTDSLSAVFALKNPHNSKHHLIEKITSQILKLPPNKITIQWIPSHTDIPGNDKADTLAKESLNLSYITQAQYSTRDAHKILNKIYSDKHYDLWYHLNESSPSFIHLKRSNAPYPFLLLPRPTQVALTRLHLLVCRLTHQHYFTKEAPYTCPHCTNQISLEHVFIICPYLNNARQTLIRECSKQKISLQLPNILDGKFPLQPLLKFLHDTNTLEKL